MEETQDSNIQGTSDISEHQLYIFTLLTYKDKIMKLIYFHGFGSSSQSGTIRTLREKLADFEVIAPDIPVDPQDALPFLKQLCNEVQPDVVIGTSMGGM